jgi:hypothetical protein
MKTAYGMIIPSCPEPGHSGCNQCRNISALLRCFGSFVESCIYSWLHSGHFMWNCFLEFLLSISDLLVSTYHNYTINQKKAAKKQSGWITLYIPETGGGGHRLNSVGDIPTLADEGKNKETPGHTFPVSLYKGVMKKLCKYTVAHKVSYGKVLCSIHFSIVCVDAELLAKRL